VIINIIIQKGSDMQTVMLMPPLQSTSFIPEVEFCIYSVMFSGQ